MKKFQLSAICALILSLPFSLSYAAWGSIEPIEPDTENYQQKEPDYGYLKNGIYGSVVIGYQSLVQAKNSTVVGEFAQSVGDGGG